MKKILLFLSILFLIACSKKEYIVKPSYIPLPEDLIKEKNTLIANLKTYEMTYPEKIKLHLTADGRIVIDREYFELDQKIATYYVSINKILIESILANNNLIKQNE